MFYLKEEESRGVDDDNTILNSLKITQISILSFACSLMKLAY
jgi:hypothetical protein